MSARRAPRDVVAWLVAANDGLPLHLRRPGVAAWPDRYVVEDRGHDTPCWVWTGGLSNGYGRVCLDGSERRAHRLFYERFRGAVPTELDLDHLCRVPACVNPAHLEPVTCGENCRRGARAKLTWAKVEAIRASDRRAVELAAEYGVSPVTISRIRRGLSWATA